MPFAAELPFAFYAIAAFVFGLLVGSFLNVVIWRVPRGESIIFPGSHCGSCGAPVKPYDNIPLISYAVLRGKCRACKTHFSLIYPAVELLTGLLFLAVIYRDWTAPFSNLQSWSGDQTFSTISPVSPVWRVIAEMVFVAVMLSLTFIDAKHQLLPNIITYPAFVFALVSASVLPNILFVSPWLYPLDSKPDDVSAGYYPFPLQPDNILLIALVGALLLAAGAPIFWLIDKLDDVLFGKYFDLSEETGSEVDSDKEYAAHKRHERIIFWTMILGVILAVGWVAASWYAVTSNAYWLRPMYERLLDAAFGALIGGGVIWLLRAAYFWTRGFEGMGLGDVKLMAVIGAFLGWQSAILVIILGSLLGSIVGLALARKSEDGMKTALPFGVFLGPAAIFALFYGQSIIQWYAGRFS